nr:immunoglobulin heavy chain junction region [Mus musculus]
CARASSLDYW